MKNSIWHSLFAPALEAIHQVPAGIEYADLTVTRECPRRMEPHNVAHCDRWLREVRSEAITQEIPVETMRQVVAS